MLRGSPAKVRGSWCAALGSPAKMRGQYRENRGPQCAANAARSAAALRSYKCKAKRPRGAALLHWFNV